MKDAGLMPASRRRRGSVSAQHWSDWALSLALAYGAVGSIVALVFLAFGIERIMPAARAGPMPSVRCCCRA